MAALTFTRLKKLAREDTASLPGYRLALLGDCATQHLATALRGQGVAVGLGLTVFDADYNQVDAQTMDPDSELYAFKPNAVLVQLCSEKLWQSFRETPVEDRPTFADATMAKIQATWSRVGANCGATILQCNFPLMDDGVFGQFGNKTADSFLFQQRRLNYLLMEECQKEKNAYLIDLDGLQSKMGRAFFSDPKLYCIAKMPLSLEALPHAAKAVVDVIQALRGAVKKCFILDLDNTLWGGVIGDDGLGGIQIGELGAGQAFSRLQSWLKELKNRGILLAVCSKNNEETAKEPFEKHPEMVLRLEDFSAFVANWEDKASNIRQIQKTLNIGMDSLVFLDDNPFERNLVRSLLPEVEVPELPEDPAMYLEYLQSLNLTETAAYSREDGNRTRQYRESARRAEFEAAFQSYDDYLKGLEMKAVVSPFDPFHYPRIAQLTQRSNQFNLRTVRCTEAEVERLAGDAGHICLYFTLRDKFGDHGLISVVVLDKMEDTLFVSQWLMSCRVLKRGMEEFIADTLLRTARERGFSKVVGEYIPTAKNAMVSNLYEKMGFTPLGGNRFEARVDSYTQHKTFIEEEKHP